MKLTIITACRNSAKTILGAMESVARQRLAGGHEIEYLVIDGASTDGTPDLVREFASAHPALRLRLVSEPDRGLYDALNKGIAMATGEAVGICNADDVLSDDDVIARVAAAFDDAVDAVYADIRFVRPADADASLDGLRSLPATRYCTGRFFRRWMFRFATFPAHPSTFVRRECFEKFGGYSLDYSICADFEMMLRLFVVHGIRSRYLPLCTHVMRAGGLSTGGLRTTFEINRQDLRALRANGVWSCLPLVYLKYFGKVWGLVRAKARR